MKRIVIISFTMIMALSIVLAGCGGREKTQK